MLGDILPAPHDAWLNAGPRASVASMCDHADIKSKMRLPIQKETHDVLLYDVRRLPECGKRNLREQAFDMQSSMATQAGYFGGYAAKMQHVGQRETQKLYEATSRAAAPSKLGSAVDVFSTYSRRLVRD